MMSRHKKGCSPSVIDLSVVYTGCDIITCTGTTIKNGMTLKEIIILLAQDCYEPESVSWGDIIGDIEEQQDLVDFIQSQLPEVSWGNISGDINEQTDLTALIESFVPGWGDLTGDIESQQDLINYLSDNFYDKEVIDTKINDVADKSTAEYYRLAEGVTTLPTNPEQGGVELTNAWTWLVPGVTYTVNGTPITTPDDRNTRADWDGVEWSLVDMGELPVTPVSNSFGSSVNDAISQAKATETNNKVDSVTKTSTSVITTPLSRTLIAANYSTTSGNVNASNNWISTEPVNIPLGTEKIKIEGFGNNVTAQSQRYFWYDDSSYLGFSGSGTSVGVHEISVYNGATKVAVAIEGYADIGDDLPNSPYQTSFKISAISGSSFNTVIDTSRIVDRIESTQLLEIESSISEIDNSNKYYDGVGYPALDLGVDSDKYLDTSSLRLYIKENGNWGNGIFMGGEEPVGYPLDFTFRPFDIVRQSNGVYIPKWEGLFNEKVKDDYERLTVYYVDPVEGLDTNNGLSPQLAVKTITNAINVKGARNIELLSSPGFYPRISNIGVFTDISSNEPLIIRGKGNVCMANSDKGNTFTWSDLGSGVFSTTRSNVTCVFDTSKFDSRGKYFPLNQVFSLEQCQSTIDSWFLNGTTLHIHREGNVSPDSASIEVSLTTFNRYTATADVPYIYIENVDFYSNSSGEAIGIRNGATTQYNFNVYLKNVGAHNNKLGNGIAINNAINVITEGCSGWGNKRDSLNYHTTNLSSGYLPTNVVEIGAYGGDCGIGSTETSSNGSTTHEGQTIIRLNSKFEICRGSVIADVNEGTKSMNCGVIANDTILEGDTSFRINGVGSKMWLFGCSGKSSLEGTTSVNANSGTTVYKDEFTKTPNGVVGNVVDI